ncbi:MAG: addiction module antidote protein, HigA family [Betaproteobacteria bacterium]|nr:addiction module antidote protein, HigA family [Betaproteobacteria bacterium]
MRKIPYPHPGEILLKEFLKPMAITQYRLAKEIGVPQRRIGEIVAGTRGVTADTGLRLSRFFGMSDGFWTGLQMDHDAAQTKDALAKTLARITPWIDHGVATQKRVRTSTYSSASLRQARR